MVVMVDLELLDHKVTQVHLDFKAYLESQETLGYQEKLVLMVALG